MSDTFHNLPPNTIKFDSLLYPVKGVVGYRNLGRIENRIVFGDPSEDDDELISAKVFSDFSGGAMVLEETEGADQGRYWDSEGVDIDHPKQLALLPRVQTFTIGGTNCMIFGESANKVHVTFDRNIYEFNETNDTFSDTTYDLTHSPVYRGIEFDGKLFAFQGANGYETFISGSGVTAGTAGITPLAGCIWDNKLAVLEHDGQVSFYDPVTDTWDTPIELLLEGSQTPRDIVSYFTRSDEPALFLVTTDALWAVDYAAAAIIRTNLQLPKHPDNGKGAAVWRVGETLHVASTMGVYAWTGPGGTTAPVGLDRRQGVPFAYQGKITDLVPTHNHLWALVEGTNTSGYHSVYRYNGSGWCRVWAHSNNSDTLRYGMATGAANRQRVWWAIGNTAYSIELPRAYSNPGEIVGNSAGTYGTTGYLITSWFDANSPGWDKLYAYLLSNIKAANYDSYGTRITVSYQDDPTDSAWTLLASLDDPGAFYNAMDFSTPQIRLKITLASADSRFSAILRSEVLKFMKVPASYGTWNVTFDLSGDGLPAVDASGNMRDTQQIAHDLETLLTKRTLITMEHNQNIYQVRVSNIQGWDSTAEDRRKSRTVTFVEVPYPVGFSTAGA